MKKIFILLVASFSMFCVFAGEGDTTIIQAHNNQELIWYENYDEPVAFPDGSISYRKIIMEFELGKYLCDKYDPNNPGEGPNQTGWCSDWDYDVHVLVMNSNGDTLELGRLITPYANSNYPRTPLSWKHAYFFDVTDYYPILKDDVTIRIHYAGWSGGFTANIKFHMIEGERYRNVVKIDPLWRGNFQYGNASNPIEDAITSKNSDIPIGANAAEMKIFITGHGGDATQNCSEFCKKWYKFIINNNLVEQKDIWRDDCGSNFLYPQSGTWVYNRANWCPGDLVKTIIHQIPESAFMNPSINAHLEFEPYFAPQNEASYKISAALFYYEDLNHNLDLGLVEIISPNIEETYYRYNPICGEPRIMVKNYGSSEITSIKFNYGIAGQPSEEYIWTGSLHSLENTEITLPSFDSLNSLTVGNHTFEVHIEEVNGSIDEESLNNSLQSIFRAAPVWEGGNYSIDFQMSGSVPQYGINDVTWTVSDMDDNILFQRIGNTSGTQFLDTLHLHDGCYKLTVDATKIGYGLNFFNMFTRGRFRIFNLNNGSLIPLPKNDLGHPSLASNFGNGFVQYFTVKNSAPLGIHHTDQGYGLNIYPNPAQDFIQIDILGNWNGEANIRLINTHGQHVYQSKEHKTSIRIPTDNLTNGIYTLLFESKGNRITEKIIIAK